MFDSFLMVLPIIISMLVGYSLKCIGMLNDEGAKQMGNIVFWIALPCLLFRITYTLRLNDLSNMRFLLLFFGSIIVSMLCAQIIELFRHGDRKRKAVSCIVVVRTNCIFMGIPTVLMLWGESRLKTFALLLALSQAGIEILAALSSLIMLYGGVHVKALKHVFKAFIRNPVVLGTVAGTLWGVCVGIELPKCIDLSLEILGGLGTGLALMTLGMKLEPKRIFSDFFYTWEDSFIRLFIVPVIIWLVFSFFPAPIAYPELEKMSILIMAMPAATSVFPMAESMGMDGDYAARCVVATTLLSIFTLPIIINLFINP